MDHYCACPNNWTNSCSYEITCFACTLIFAKKMFYLSLPLRKKVYMMYRWWLDTCFSLKQILNIWKVYMMHSWNIFRLIIKTDKTKWYFSKYKTNTVDSSKHLINEKKLWLGGDQQNTMKVNERLHKRRDNFNVKKLKTKGFGR